MRGFARRTGIVSAFVVGVFLAIFFGFLNHNRNLVTCTGCQLPFGVSVAKVSIPRGTSGTVIATKGLSSTKYVQRSRTVLATSVDPSDVRGEVTTRIIPAGARLTAADFVLRGRLYYPRGYPKRVPTSQTPARMHLYFGPPAPRLALAPGVWMDGAPPSVAVDVHVANGTLIGYCSSVQAFEAHNSGIQFATKCWRG